ncbi:MAG: hypothetical protein UV94_C0026G0001, partial [Parcubacteria group bacterium GW2011_GWC1_43_30]
MALLVIEENAPIQQIQGYKRIYKYVG